MVHILRDEMIGDNGEVTTLCLSNRWFGTGVSQRQVAMDSLASYKYLSKRTQNLEN